MTAATHTVFGTGPAGRAVATALVDQGARVRMVNRTGTPVLTGVETIGGDATDPAFARDVAANTGATMKLLGERNWWAPAPLRRFHQRFGLHEAPAPTTPHAGEPSIDLSQTTEETEPEVEVEPVGAGSGTMLR
jgi:hypothetical protein